jgi:hypothetical protein
VIQFCYEKLFKESREECQELLDIIKRVETAQQMKDLGAVIMKQENYGMIKQVLERSTTFLMKNNFPVPSDAHAFGNGSPKRRSFNQGMSMTRFDQ